MPRPQAQTSFLTVARLIRTRGNRGELAAELEADDAAILDRFPEVYVWDGGERRQPVRIQHAWPHKDRLVIKFEGIDTISEAQRLAGWEVQIRVEQRPPAAQGRYYLSDLIGAKVVDARNGRELGAIEEFIETGGTPLLRVARGGRELLIPFASSICVQIDPENRTVSVEVPEGLEELNED